MTMASLPVSRLAPLDYRYALDGALALLGGSPATARCDQPELVAELTQRLAAPDAPCAPGALWVEPQAASWPETLGALAAGLTRGTALAVVASRPLADLIPERRGWGGAALGARAGGIARLHRGLAAAGLRVELEHGAHSLRAIGLNSLGRLVARCGRPDLGDRLEFAARLRYGARGPAAALATVAVILARKEA